MKPRLLLIPALVLLAAACSTSATSDTARPAGQGGALADASSPGSYEPEPYCELTLSLEAAGQEAFGGLGRDATPAQYRSAELRFILDNQEVLDSLADAAPAHLADELDTFLTAMRQRGGLEDSGVTLGEATDAERRILAFEKRHC